MLYILLDMIGQETNDIIKRAYGEKALSAYFPWGKKIIDTM